MSMSLLGELLVDGPNAPMYQELIQSNLGMEYAPGTGYHGHNREGYFVVGLQGISGSG